MKKAGIGLIALGFYCVLFAFNMDVVVGKTYNIGLMNERQNVVFLSGIIFLAGIILFGFGFSAKEESKNLKTFAISCFLSPVLLLVGIKMATSVQELITKQSNIRRQAAIDAQEYKEQQKKKEKEKEEQAEEQNREIELSARKEIAKKVLEEYANEFTNNKINRNFNVSENLVRAAIDTNLVDTYTSYCLISDIEIKDSSDFSVAIYRGEPYYRGGAGNSFLIGMIGFMNGKIIKPTEIGGRISFRYKTISINKRIIEFDGVTLGENDGWCCPSKPMTKKFEISENGFREITEKQ